MGWQDAPVEDISPAWSSAPEIGKEEPTFYSSMVEPNIGLLYGMGSMAQDTGARIGQIARSIGEKTGLVPEGSRLAYTREYDKKRAERDLFYKEQFPSEGFQEGAKVGGVVQSIAQVPFPATSLLGRTAVGSGVGALQYVPEGDTTLGYDSDIANPVISGLGAAVAPYVVKTGVETFKGIGNIGRGLYNKATGVPNPFKALHEQGYPIARQISGLNDVQPPQAQAMRDYTQNVDDIAAATGRRPDALLSQQFGSDRLAKAEGATAASPAITDRAFNERQRLIKITLDAADDVASKLNKGFISPERGGKLLAASQNRAINSTWDDAAANYRREAKPLFDLFEKTGNRPIVGQANQLRALQEIEQMAAVQGQSNEKVFSAIKRTSETLSVTGNLKLDAALSRRGAFSKQSTGNKFLGIDDPKVAKQAAWKMAQAVEADIGEAAIKASARAGVPYPGDAIKRANAAYSTGADKAKGLEDNVFGTLLGKKNSTFEDFTKAALKMPDSQFRNHMAALREVNPNIDKQMGRFLMDKAMADAKLGARATATSAGIDTSLYFKTIQDNAKFMATIPKQNRAQVSSILKQMERLSDRVGASGGGAAADPLATVAAQGQALTTGDPGFLMRAAYRFVIGPMMHQALYTEKGRQALLVVGRDYLKSVPTSAYVSAVKTLTDMKE